MDYTELIEKIARTIYYHDGGMTPDEYKKVTGEYRSNWAIHYDFQKENGELAQHERDDYRIVAEAVINRLMSLGVVEIAIKGKIGGEHA